MSNFIKTSFKSWMVLVVVSLHVACGDNFEAVQATLLSAGPLSSDCHFTASVRFSPSVSICR